LTRDGINGILYQDGDIVSYGKEINFFQDNNNSKTLKYKILNLQSPRISHKGILA
jgi:hypothetical protein